jgi:phosphoesterase RecJ-like protein
MINRIVDIIHSCETFLITSHVRLDGDALGSELALWHVLRDMGKEAVVYNGDMTPTIYEFLSGTDAIIHNLHAVHNFDAAFVLDCSELERIGEEGRRIGSIKQIINIDHHISNNFFSEVSLVDSNASSTGEILYHIIEKLGVHITKDIAINLYTAILTDTGAFRYSNTGSHTLFVAAKLVEAGADPRWIAENVYETKSKAQIRLLKDALHTLEFDCQDKVGSIFVSQPMLQEAKALPEHTEGFVDLIRSIKGVEVAVFFHETSKNNYKISLRSKGRINVEKIARNFGGGGHVNASACSIEGNIVNAKKKLFAFIKTAEI